MLAQRALSSSAVSDKDRESLSGESETLLSDYTSDTSFFNGGSRVDTTSPAKDHDDAWKFHWYRSEGKVHIFFEWVSKTKSVRYVVIGPEWQCLAVTYIVIIVPSALAEIYLIQNEIERIVFLVVISFSILGLFMVSTVDPGLGRTYHHARSRRWTYW